MKAFMRIAVVFVILGVSAVSAFAQGKKAAAPGQADTFYRGVTTIVVSDETVRVTTTDIISQETETRTIGGGQANNNRDGNLQDRTVSVVETTVTDIRTVVTDQHRGVAHSSGKDLGTTTEVTETVVSRETETVVGDWGSAYDVPSGMK